jgi:hypothetical protein
MPDLSTLLQWLPQGGAAAAVIIVVQLFLKQQDKMATLIIGITDKFSTALEAYQTRYEAQHEKMQGQITELVRDQIASNTHMTDAIKGLQAAVSDLQKKD